jgi:hypothetical protein
MVTEDTVDISDKTLSEFISINFFGIHDGRVPQLLRAFPCSLMRVTPMTAQKSQFLHKNGFELLVLATRFPLH